MDGNVFNFFWKRTLHFFQVIH